MTGRIAWSSAAGMAGKMAGHYPLGGTYHEDLLRRQAPEFVDRAGRLVMEETGLTGPGVPNVAVVSRSEWATQNIRFFAKIMEPAEERLIERFQRSGLVGKAAAAASHKLVATEMGALLGFMARRVLGQYELVLPADEDNDGDTVYLVGENVLRLERTHQFRPLEFRFWLALHECTHRLQFVGVSWMQDYFLGLVQELVATAQPEPGRLGRLLAEARSAASEGRPLVGETGLLGLFASHDQRAMLDRVQALMSFLEGHGHVVMDRIGNRLLVTQKRMSDTLKQRRKDPRTAAFYRLTGLEMKMRQYELGERFVLGIERRAGWGALDHAWESSEHLPTLEEIEHPEQWLARVA
ncbi:MAG: zinc-dependent metalloprotease [Acidimicrobiia bacterium]